MEAMLKLRSELPDNIRDILVKNEDAGTLDNREYQKAKMFFLSKHALRISPPPAGFKAAVQALKEDSTVNFTT